jgi:hypothetical protein
MLISFVIAPDMWVGDYPPDIKEKYGDMSDRAKRYRPLVAFLFFGSIFSVTALSISQLRLDTQDHVDFWSYLLSTFIVLMVFNLFDLLIVDWLIFVTIQPKTVILPGTEGMAGYKNYPFHFRGFLIGIGFSGGGALIFSVIAMVVISLLC